MCVCISPCVLYFIAEFPYIHIQAIVESTSRNTWLSKTMVMYGNLSSFLHLKMNLAKPQPSFTYVPARDVNNSKVKFNLKHGNVC